MQWRLVVVAGLVVALVGGVALADKKGAARQPAPAPAEELPGTARMLVLPKMRTHRFDMERLLRAVLLLEREEAARIAGELASEPRLARPVEQDATNLNSLVPPRFYELQDNFESAARRLAERAPKATNEALAEDFAKLTRTCIACHGEFLNPPGTATKP